MIAPWSNIRPIAATLTLVLLAGCGGLPMFDKDSTSQPTKSPDAAALLRVADNVAAAGDYGSALSFYQSVLEKLPGDPRALAGLGAAHAGLGQNELAHMAFSRALAAEPGMTAARLGLANSYIASGRPPAALDELERVIAEAPDNARAHNALGITLDLLGRNGEAQLSYGRALDLAPGDRDIGVNLALSFAIAGDYQTGVGLLRDIAREPGADARIRQNLALVYGLAGDYERARAIASLDLNPEEVASNLAYYAEIGALSPRRRALAIFLGPDFVAEDGAAEQKAAPARETIDPPRVIRLDLDRYHSREQALVAWARNDRLADGLLAGLNPDVTELPATDGDPGPRFQLGTAYHGTAAAVRRLCAKLSARGVVCRPTPAQ